MKYYVAVTDNDWFNTLRDLSPEDVNFWQPSGTAALKELLPGGPFLFKLKGKLNVIGGIGFFSSHTLLPVSYAWEIFRERNGARSFQELFSTISSFRTEHNSLSDNPIIGCSILTNPLFFDREDWIQLPNWSTSIVRGKYYDTRDRDGGELWQVVEFTVQKYLAKKDIGASKNQIIPQGSGSDYSKKILGNVRLGQGAFRVLVTDAYNRKCSISGEKTLPVLEAAHIKPYSILGPSYISNGLLLRADLHKLFDYGYITINPDYKVEISGKIKEEFQNGKEYYKFHGQRLLVLPSKEEHLPKREYLEWHNSYAFRQ